MDDEMEQIYQLLIKIMHEGDRRLKLIKSSTNVTTEEKREAMRNLETIKEYVAETNKTIDKMVITDKEFDSVWHKVGRKKLTGSEIAKHLHRDSNINEHYDNLDL